MPRPPVAPLFVPATAPRRHTKAFASGADGVIVDLEDAVGPDEKGAARAALPAALAARTPGVAALVRINDPTTEVGAADVDALAAAPANAPDAIVVPKVSVTGVAVARRAGVPIVALVETAAAVLEAAQIAATAGVAQLMLGPVDLRAELGVEESPAGTELLAARSQLVLASAAAGLPPPLDGPCLQVDDEAALRRELEQALTLGFGGKACIHPRQVAATLAGFRPSAEQLRWASAVVAAFEAALARGEGVCAVDGQMVDRPVFERARRLLERDEREELR